MKFDLHIHTYRSNDSFSSIKKIIHYAKKRDLKGIAITDHGITCTAEYEDIALENDIWLIKGNEFHSDLGDIIGLFISEDLKRYKAGELIDEIHDSGGIAILAHPFKYVKHYPDDVLSRLDAIEVVNARWKDLDQFMNLLHVQNLLSAVKGRSAGSDAHFPFEVGRACWITSEISTQEELRESICENKGYAHAEHCSDWLDEASQCIKFMKNPSARQLARVAYGTFRRLTFAKRRRL